MVKHCGVARNRRSGGREGVGHGNRRRSRLLALGMLRGLKKALCTLSGFKKTLSTIVAILVFFATLTVAAPKSASFQVNEVELENTTGELADFLARLHHVGAIGAVGQPVHKSHVGLPYSTPDDDLKNVPWIKIKVLENGIYKIALYIEGKSLYLLAYAKVDGTTYCMKGYGYLFPGATELPFAEDYASLTGKVGNQKVSDLIEMVQLGREAVRIATNILSTYDPEDPTQVEPARRSMLLYTVMIPESMRFKAVAARCIQTWLSGGTLNNIEARRLGVWAKFSKVFYEGDLEDGVITKYVATLKDLGATTIKDIDGILDFVKQPWPKGEPRGWKKSKKPGSDV